MNNIRITKTFEFDAAHALYNYDGLCSNIHGHSYKLQVTIIGKPSIDIESHKLGMVMDFGVFKNIIKKNIIDVFDHSLIINKNNPIEKEIRKNEMFNRLHTVDFQPTVENMIIYMKDIITTILPENVKLYKIKLYETSSSFAEWCIDDQE